MTSAGILMSTDPSNWTHTLDTPTAISGPDLDITDGSRSRRTTPTAGYGTPCSPGLLGTAYNTPVPGTRGPGRASRGYARSPGMSPSKSPTINVEPPPGILDQSLGDLGRDQHANDVIEEESEDTDEEDSGSGYDTDIDLENDRELRRKPKERDDIQAYMDACVALATVPQSRILRQLSEDVLDIRHRSIGPMGCRALSAALLHNIHVEELILEDNGIGAGGCAAVCEMIVENDIVQYLNIAENDMRTDGAIAFGEGIKYNKGITKLDLSSNFFCDGDSEFLSAGLQVNETIRSLNLSHNGFAIRSGQAFGLALAVNYTLRKLDLSWNHIREKGAVALCKGLQENCCLTHLDLSYNGMGYEGSLAIGDMLKANSVLQELNISHNRVTWRAAPLICKGLKANETLQVLRIGCNPLTTTGCIDVLEAVSGKNSAVSELDIQGVCVISEYEMLATAIAQNRKFSYTHGGIVPTHDVLGERHGAKLTPMQRVINYMKQTGIRATELFRNMDKQVNKEISKEEMVARLKKNGIDMATHEAQELLDHLERNASFSAEEGGSINYKNVARTVHDQILQDRTVKIKTRESEKRMKKYHEEILRKGILPPISDASEFGDGKFATQSELNMSLGLRSQSRISMDSREGRSQVVRGYSGTLQRSQSVGESRKTTLYQDSPSALARDRLLQRMTSVMSSVLPQAASSSTSSQKPLILSMSKPLGSKAAAFGSGAKKKKRKKKKKKAK